MTLSEIYLTEMEEKQAAQQAAARQQAATLAEKQRDGVAYLERYLERWAPLRSALGLKGAPEVDELRATLRGQTSINNLPVETMAWSDLPPFKGATPHLQIMIKSQRFPQEAVALAQIDAAVDGSLYPKRLGVLCSIWMEQYARAAAEAERAERMKAETLAKARRIVELSKIYQERLALYKEECRQWAEQEAARLWTPHVLWRVRYRPFLGLGEGGEDEIETVVCMEAPEDILNSLRQFPTATITTVDQYRASIEEREIPSFVDAHRMAFNAHDYTQGMFFHRSVYTKTEIVLNIPAHEDREPTPPPPFPGWAAFLGETVDDGYISPWEDLDPTRLAAMMPEEVLKHYLQVWT